MFFAFVHITLNRRKIRIVQFNVKPYVIFLSTSVFHFHFIQSL